MTSSENTHMPPLCTAGPQANAKHDMWVTLSRVGRRLVTAPGAAGLRICSRDGPARIFQSNAAQVAMRPGAYCSSTASEQRNDNARESPASLTPTWRWSAGAAPPPPLEPLPPSGAARLATLLPMTTRPRGSTLLRARGSCSFGRRWLRTSCDDTLGSAGSIAQCFEVAEDAAIVSLRAKRHRCDATLEGTRVARGITMQPRARVQMACAGEETSWGGERTSARRALFDCTRSSCPRAAPRSLAGADDEFSCARRPTRCRRRAPEITPDAAAKHAAPCSRPATTWRSP